MKAGLLGNLNGINFQPALISIDYPVKDLDISLQEPPMIHVKVKEKNRKTDKKHLNKQKYHDDFWILQKKRLE